MGSGHSEKGMASCKQLYLHLKNQIMLLAENIPMCKLWFSLEIRILLKLTQNMICGN